MATIEMPEEDEVVEEQVVEIHAKDRELVEKLATALDLPVTFEVSQCYELDERGHVSSLELSSLKLKGDLPYGLLDEFAHLELLDLGWNGFTGGVQELPVKSRVVYLDHNPRLGGELPTPFKMRHLRVFWAQGCGLSGHIPHSLQVRRLGGQPRLPHLPERRLTPSRPSLIPPPPAGPVAAHAARAEVSSCTGTSVAVGVGVPPNASSSPSQPPTHPPTQPPSHPPTHPPTLRNPALG